RSLGANPTLVTGISLVDAYLWIKTPGDSDGACGNDAPAAGQWWQPYADMLYANRKK
ncbi:glycoside hydrolase family 6 protein, partial [Candidatus Saccharibacteria bacterium]|nr:glycoside hydrolase family 6 protein [Candidatus Saccharibacteria bacterium]